MEKPGDPFLEIGDFIDRNIDSVSQLEALLLLRSNPEREWSSDGMAESLFIPPAKAADCLAGLVERGLAVITSGTIPRFRYGPRSEELRRKVDVLAEVYAKRLVEVSRRIHSRPRSAVRAFGEAFRLKED